MGETVESIENIRPSIVSLFLSTKCILDVDRHCST